MKQAINFSRINRLALNYLPVLLQRWLPGGKRVCHEYTVRNPTRNDRCSGSFKINLRTGHWADFATGDKGGDIISLAAYLFHLTQGQAAHQIINMLEINNV
ncbi:MAG: hypothetical protein V3V61_04880 [Gammaproteobacteria bacterium]